MSKYLACRSVPLKDGEKLEMLQKHIPYRLEMLNTYKLLHQDKRDLLMKIPNEVRVPVADVCVTEASRIAARLFIEFMGLKHEHFMLKKSRKYYAPDGETSYEVKIVDVGGKWVDPDELSQSQQDLLVKAYHTGNKATAHFTYGAENIGNLEILIPCIALINELLHQHLKGIEKNNP